MKVVQNAEPLQELLHSSFRAIGYIVTIGLAACLILAWVLTAPLIRCGVYLSDRYHARFEPKMQGSAPLFQRPDKPGPGVVGGPVQVHH